MEGVKERRILVAVDESEQSMYALKWAVDNLQLTPADTLILCNVKLLPLVYSLPTGVVLTSEASPSWKKYENRIAKDVIKKAKEICGGSHVKVEEKIVSGDASESLCEAVKKLGVDFLVIGSHGYGTIKRFFLGSVSDYCAHHAKCPVLIVKKPHH